MLGTVAAGCCFYWRILYWPERFGYAWTPYGAFLLVGSHIFDLIYPFVFVYVRRYEKTAMSQLEGPKSGGLVNAKKQS